MKDSKLDELIQKRIYRTRKKRNDDGIPRRKYQKHIPAKYKSYVYRANRKGLEFDFTVDEFMHLLNQNCSYCGSEGVNGADRIDSKGSYTKDNVIPCCYKCNIMKFTSIQQDFLDQVDKIYHYQHQ